MPEPITPKEARSIKNSRPAEVMETFNELIASNIDGGRSSFSLSDVIELVAKKLNIKTCEVKMTDLNIKFLYENAGWIVDQPNFYYDVAPRFVFTDHYYEYGAK